MEFSKSYYEILEVRDTASAEVIKMAYKALALKYHPDKFRGDRATANVQMQKINEAYEVLSNIEKRKQYDEYLMIFRKQTENRKKEESNDMGNNESRYQNNQSQRDEAEQNGENIKHESINHEKRYYKKIVPILSLLIIVSLILIKFIIPSAQYDKGIHAMDSKNYSEAINIFKQLGDYQNSGELLSESYYQFGLELMKSKDYTDAINYFKNIESYKDSTKLINKAQYQYGLNLLENNDWKGAMAALVIVDKELYPDASVKLDVARKKYDLENSEKYYQQAQQYISTGSFLAAYNILKNLNNYKDSVVLLKECEKKAFSWSFDGEMNQSTYTKFDSFQLEGTIHGGLPGETIDLVFTCTTPDWTNTQILKDAYDSLDYGVYFYNREPNYASSGTGKITVKIRDTGEVLEKYYFDIY